MRHQTKLDWLASDKEWLVFYCPHCTYVRKVKLKTGDTKLIDPGDLNVAHSGSINLKSLELS